MRNIVFELSHTITSLPLGIKEAELENVEILRDVLKKEIHCIMILKSNISKKLYVQNTIIITYPLKHIASNYVIRIVVRINNKIKTCKGMY